MAHVIWLTGISGSGKTTLGLLLQAEFDNRQKKAEFLDGDIVRDFFEGDLGFSRPERIMNVRRVAFAAVCLAKSGSQTLVANIAPYYEARDFIRRHTEDYFQIYLKLSLAEARKRDPKGYYEKYDKGEMRNLVGVDEPYDIPRNPDLVAETGTETEAESLHRIVDALAGRGIL